ncbi:hypothetical protein AN476_08685 [Phaeobacter sp. 11ANDIMAR09]|nr:hypothetical protein AN476_08685 [Phaeobacter sp. 11ANDIMAR09]
MVVLPTFMIPASIQNIIKNIKQTQFLIWNLSPLHALEKLFLMINYSFMSIRTQISSKKPKQQGDCREG